MLLELAKSVAFAPAANPLGHDFVARIFCRRFPS